MTSMFIVYSWLLIHHAGTFTPPHQDNSGSISLVEARAGSKFWAVFKPVINDKRHKSSHESLIATLRDMVHERRTRQQGKIVDVINITNVASGVIIEVNPGDIM